jgi:hypothetical protein
VLALQVWHRVETKRIERVEEQRSVIFANVVVRILGHKPSRTRQQMQRNIERFGNGGVRAGEAVWQVFSFAKTIQAA